MATLTGRTFFPQLISEPFRHGLAIAFGVSIAMLLIAAVASLLRGERYVHADAMGAETAARLRQSTAVHEGTGVALAREAAALDGIPGQDVAYEDALADPKGARRAAS